MAKFSKGSRVRVRLDYRGSNTYKAGEEYTISESTSRCYWVEDGPGGRSDYIDARNLELISSPQYTPINPINQLIIQKSMSFIKRLTQSADDKALLKARFTDDCGNLTSRGQDALTSLVFAEKKAELVKLAEEVIAEEKE